MRYLLLFIVFGLFSCSEGEKLPVVEELSLDKYQGRWYEIATFPIRPQKHCKCTYAEYTLKEDFVEVYNRCIDKRDGSVIDIQGKAKPEDESSNARLEVSFFPLMHAPYYVIELDKEAYQYAVVGSPNRKYLWILSRTPSMDQALYNNLLSKAKGLGFPIENLVLTQQDC